MSEKIIFKSGVSFFRKHYTAKEAGARLVQQQKLYVGIVRHYLDQFLDFPILNQKWSRKGYLPEEYASYIRKEWGLSDRPIEDMMSLLEQKGFVGAFLADENSEVRSFGGSVIVDGREYYILMEEAWTSFYRQQFSLAHELGHWLMHRDMNPETLSLTLHKQVEDEANEFAAAFLLPKSRFIYSMGDNPTDLEQYRKLKREWGVSILLMVMRAKQLNIIDSVEYSSLLRQFEARGWNKGEPLDNVKLISQPNILKQGVELVVENGIVDDILANIEQDYGISLPAPLIERLINAEDGYLSQPYKNNPKVIYFDNRKRRKH